MAGLENGLVITVGRTLMKIVDERDSDGWTRRQNTERVMVLSYENEEDCLTQINIYRRQHVPIPS